MKREYRGGFSLVEVLIGLMLTALLLQGLFSLLSTSFKSWQVILARTQTHQTARMAMESMVRELRPASAINSPLPGQVLSGIRIVRPDMAGNSYSLVFQLGTTLGGNPRTVYRIAASGQPTPLTENTVTELQFELKPPRLVVIRLTVTDPQTGVSDSLDTAVTCINVPD